MNLKTTKLRDAITFALVAGATTVAGSGTAFAQSTAPSQEQATTLDRIQVTGSRIRRVDMETAQPVLTVSRTDIENQGFQSVGDILQNLAVTGSPALSRSSPLNAGESPGGTYVNLRNLGAQRTLVLVNGRRMGINNDGLQDLSTIPSSAVERIEVLKDGASSLYGSDAIAGVINIITRRNFDGAEANAYIGQYGEGDGQTQSFDFSVGATGERSSVVLGVQYDKEDPVWARDRRWAIDTYPGFEETRGNSFTVVGAIGSIRNPANPSQWLVLRDGGDPTHIADYRPQVAGPNGDTSNAAEQMMARTGMERTSIYTSADFTLTDNIRFVTDASYNRRETDVQVAGYPYQSAAIDVQTPISADSYFNPTDAALDFRRRGWEVPRTTHRKLDTYRFSGVFEGTFDFGDRFLDWDAGYMYTRSDATIRARGDFNKIAVRQAVGPSFLNSDGIVQCGSAANPIPLTDCTPWSPALTEGQYSLANPDIQNRFFLTENATSETETNNFFANVSGVIAPLPAGYLGFATGVEHRKVTGRYSPDAFAQTGNSTNLAAQETSGGYSVDEVYLEFDIPLLADVPGFQELSLNVASRYSDYDVFGDTVNSKASFTWKPIDDVLVRGTWAQGFRAPSVAQLYGGTGQSFDTYTDPCDSVQGIAARDSSVRARCAADIAGYTTIGPDGGGYRQLGQGGAVNYAGQTGTPFLSGSDPNLTPEEAVSRSLGIVYSPSYLEGLGVSLDWWRTRIDNVLTSFTASGILEDCYVNDIASQCQYFTRSEETGVVDSLIRTGRNAGYWDIEGWDLGVNYVFQETGFGRFGFNWDSTYYSNFETKADSTENTSPQPNVSWLGNFRIRSVASLNWDYGDFGATWTARYYSGSREACVFRAVYCSNPDFVNRMGNNQPINETGSNTFNDVQVRWSAPWNATVSVGVNNVFDREGQIMFRAPNSGFAYHGSFDIGRFTYMRYQQRF